MAIENADARFKAAKEKHTIRGADGSETYEVTVEQGTEKQIHRMPKGSVESSVPFSQWKEVDPQPKTIRPADTLSTDAAPLAPDATVNLGDRVTVTPSNVTGFEASFTRNYSAYDVTLDGKIVRSDAALKAIYEALRETQTPKGRGK